MIIKTCNQFKRKSNLHATMLIIYKPVYASAMILQAARLSISVTIRDAF